MSKLNEREIIRIFQEKLGNKKITSEDVEVFKLGKTSFIAKIDTLVESTDIPPGTKLEDAARKSVVACVSDFASKGVKPHYGIVSVTLPRRFSKLKIINLASALAKAAKEFNFKFLGGDTNEGKELVIQVCLFGTSKKIIPRKGARTNDIIITTGPFGYSAAGLKIILKKLRSNSSFTRKAKKATLRPTPRLHFGNRASKYFSSSMDSSDGLSTTLNEMAKQSRKRFVITKLPVNQDLLKFAQKTGLEPLDLILHGGEEYEIVATVPTSNLKKVMNMAKVLKIPVFEIGFVSNGAGVVYKSNSKIKKLENKGWRHFES